MYGYLPRIIQVCTLRTCDYISVSKLMKIKTYVVWLPKLHKIPIKQDLLLILVLVRRQNVLNC